VFQTSLSQTSFRPSKRLHNTPRRRASGFSLIELLVVVSVIGLLIGLLLPALAAARFQARVTTCSSRLHQIGVAVHAYAADARDVLPFGPPDPDGVQYFGDTLATNQVYSQSHDAFTAHGLLLRGGYLGDEQAVFCPGDDTLDPVEELAKLQDRNADAFSSYMSRQRDERLTDGGAELDSPTLDRPGVNSDGEPARALVFDLNFLSLAFGPGQRRSNHEHRVVNALFVGGNVRSLKNAASAEVDGPFVVPESATFATFQSDIDQLLINLDAER